MKKIINGKVYDTDTANQIKTNKNQVTLYQKKNKEFFNYYQRAEDKDKIRPLTLTEAKNWGQIYLTNQEYKQAFSKPKYYNLHASKINYDLAQQMINTPAPNSTIINLALQNYFQNISYAQAGTLPLIDILNKLEKTIQNRRLLAIYYNNSPLSQEHPYLAIVNTDMPELMSNHAYQQIVDNVLILSLKALYRELLKCRAWDLIETINQKPIYDSKQNHEIDLTSYLKKITGTWLSINPSSYLEAAQQYQKPAQKQIVNNYLQQFQQYYQNRTQLFLDLKQKTDNNSKVGLEELKQIKPSVAAKRTLDQFFGYWIKHTMGR